jgi:glycine oxidase
MSHPSGPDVLIVGGGVAGLAVAWEAASLGMGVCVLDRGPLGGGATRAAAGMLSPLDEAHRGQAMVAFAACGLRAYPEWIAGLEAASGLSAEFRGGGKLSTAVTGKDVDSLGDLQRLAADHGFRAEWLGPAELRATAPSLNDSLIGGLLIPDECRVDNRALAVVLAEACRRRGVELHPESPPVRSVLVEGGRARGLDLENGRRVHGGSVVVAAGAWAANLDGLPRPLPVTPYRGQMLAVRPATPLPSRIVASSEVYLVPRDDGRLLVGATVEDVGFNEANTVEGIAGLLRAAMTLAPGLASSPIVEVWSGLRPGTADGLPILGADPEVEGLYYATGHFRSGILLAPATGQVFREIFASGRSSLLPPALSAARLA